MELSLAIEGVLAERNALQQPEGVSSPSYISEHMQRLAQYNSALEECVANKKEEVDKKEGDLFKKYRKAGKSVNAAETDIKYELAADRAEVTRLTRLCSTSWRFISVSQSRIKHLLAEANNQI